MLEYLKQSSPVLLQSRWKLEKKLPELTQISYTLPSEIGFWTTPTQITCRQNGNTLVSERQSGFHDASEAFSATFKQNSHSHSRSCSSDWFCPVSRWALRQSQVRAVPFLERSSSWRGLNQTFCHFAQIKILLKSSQRDWNDLEVEKRHFKMHH